MLNKISYRTINIIKYASVGFVFAASTFVLAYLLSRQMSDITQGIRTYNNISAQRQRRIDFSLQLSKDIEAIGASNEAKLQTALIIDENISDIVQIINNLATKHAVNHTSPSIGGITSAPQSEPGKLVISSVDYNMQMTTNVNSLINYLRELEGNKNFISTTSFSIIGDTKTGWDGSATVNVNGKIYYRSTSQ